MEPKYTLECKNKLINLSRGTTMDTTLGSGLGSWCRLGLGVNDLGVEENHIYITSRKSCEMYENCDSIFLHNQLSC